MQLVKFSYKKKKFWGILRGQAITIIDGLPWPKIKPSKIIVPLNRVKVLAPYEGGKIILAGLNYKEHARELSMPIPESPVIFMKPSTSVIGPNQKIIYPSLSKNVHYEAELAFMVGKEAKNIDIKDAKKHIIGYTCLNDVTARDLQKIDGQWTRAKSFDTFCPIGPCIDTTFDWRHKRVRTLVNGKIHQDGGTDDFIFPPERLIAFISNIMTLNPGDIISTGTPSGVGPLLKGDRVEIHIDGIGYLPNVIY
jgi:2-keto-4-pentenoate hydratase/2-oxohepta-3-ene-1,7-dioic acid hydratase in catechol pathway